MIREELLKVSFDNDEVELYFSDGYRIVLTIAEAFSFSEGLEHYTLNGRKNNFTWYINGKEC